MKNLIIVLILFLAIIALPVWNSVSAQGLSSSTCISLSSNLKYKANNSSVKKLQRFLNSMKYLKSEPTGYFGSATLSAVKRFQTANGISPTGLVGSKTRQKFQVSHVVMMDMIKVIL